MNRGKLNRSGRAWVGAMAAAAVIGLAGASALADTNWNVQNGNWNDAGSWSNGIPVSGAYDYFNNVGAGNSTVAISGATALGRSIFVQGGKTVTFNFASGSSMDLDTNGYLNLGLTNDAGNNHATLNGPASGSATANITYVNMGYVTNAPNSLTINGANLTVTTDTTASVIKYGNALTITGGATLKGTDNPGGQFVVSDNDATHTGTRLTVDDGTLTSKYITLGDDNGHGGLLQLGTQGHLTSYTSDTTTVYIYQTARFEAEGSGIGSTVRFLDKAGGTLAVGVTPIGGPRTAAATLTLQNNDNEMSTGSLLEMGLFGNGTNDQINLAASGVLTGTTTLKLVLHNGYTPTAGDSWTLFTGSTSNLSGLTIDTSALGPNYYVSKFNQADGWKISYVPEPASMTLLGLGAFLLAGRSWRRGRH